MTSINSPSYCEESSMIYFNISTEKNKNIPNWDESNFLNRYTKQFQGLIDINHWEDDNQRNAAGAHFNYNDCDIENIQLPLSKILGMFKIMFI